MDILGTASWAFIWLYIYPTIKHIEKRLNALEDRSVTDTPTSSEGPPEGSKR
jgi:hypothetical protein